MAKPPQLFTRKKKSMRFYPGDIINPQNDVVFFFNYLSLTIHPSSPRVLHLLLHPRGRSSEFTKIKAKLKRAVQISTTRVLRIHERFACHIRPSFLVQRWFGFCLSPLVESGQEAPISDLKSATFCLQTAHCMSFSPTHSLNMQNREGVYKPERVT